MLGVLQFIVNDICVLELTTVPVFYEVRKGGSMPSLILAQRYMALVII